MVVCGVKTVAIAIDQLAKFQGLIGFVRMHGACIKMPSAQDQRAEHNHAEKQPLAHKLVHGAESVLVDRAARPGGASLADDLICGAILDGRQ